MNAIKVAATVEKDGELYLTSLPCRKGDKVEAIILIPQTRTQEEREKARQEFLALAKASKFCSIGPYPSRDELHVRH